MPAAKPEAGPPPAAAKGDAKADAKAVDAKAAEAAAPAGDGAKGGAKGFAAFIPLIAVLVLAPAISWAVGQFVLLPQLKKELALPATAHAAEPAAEEPAAEEPAGEAHGGGHGKKGEGAAAPANTYEFANIVVNLSGTMGTRYLKTTFLVTGTDKALRGTFEGNKAKLLDVTLNVLSSLSLADLEEAGAKNLIREKLIGAYNQALNKKVAEQVYFSDFVVQ
jgi:flagellar FliL protein